MKISSYTGGDDMKLDNVSRDEIVKLYCDERLPMRVLAEKFSCSKATIQRRIKAEKIKTRGLCEYPPTDKQLSAWSKCGSWLTTEDRSRIGKNNKGKPKNKSRKTGEAATEWEFGMHERKDKAGYILVYCPDHPRAGAACAPAQSEWRPGSCSYCSGSG